jgi:hypothetical protein
MRRAQAQVLESIFGHKHLATQARFVYLADGLLRTGEGGGGARPSGGVGATDAPADFWMAVSNASA